MRSIVRKSRTEIRAILFIIGGFIALVSTFQQHYNFCKSSKYLENKQKIIFKDQFVNKSIDMINLSRIFRDANIYKQNRQNYVQGLTLPAVYLLQWAKHL